MEEEKSSLSNSVPSSTINVGFFNSIYNLITFNSTKSFNKALEQSEKNLLKIGGIVFDSYCKSYFVRIGKLLQDNEKEQDHFINTLAVDILDGLQDIHVDDNGVLDMSDQIENSRSPLLICHGFGAGLGFFYKNLRAIADQTKRRVYALDWIGMGRSSRPKFPWKTYKDHDETADAIDYFVESLEEWRKKSLPNNKKMILVGHSLGGYLSTWYALKYPEHVEKLILVSPVGLPEQPPASNDGVTQSGRQMPSWVTHLWNNNYTPQWLIRSMGPFGYNLVKFYTSRRFSQLDPSELQSLNDYLYHISSHDGSGEYSLGVILAPGAWARKPLISEFKRLSVPTSFIYGDSDWMDFRHAEKAKENANSADLSIFIVSKADHHMYIDNPQEFNQLIAKIVNE